MDLIGKHSKGRIPIASVKACPHLKPFFQDHMAAVWDTMMARMKIAAYRGFKGPDRFGRAHTAWCFYGIFLKSILTRNPYARTRIYLKATLKDMSFLTGLSINHVCSAEFLGAKPDVRTAYLELGLERVEFTTWHELCMIHGKVLRRLVTGFGKSEPHIDAAWVEWGTVRTKERDKWRREISSTS